MAPPVAAPHRTPRILAALWLAGLTLAATAEVRADERLKDLLGRAQQQLDGKAVEDLIGKLEGGKQKTPATKPTETKAPEPAAAATPPANTLTIPGFGQPTGRPVLPSAPPAELAAPPPPSGPAAAPAAAQSTPPAPPAIPAKQAAPLPDAPPMPAALPGPPAPPPPSETAKAPPPPPTSAPSSPPAATAAVVTPEAASSAADKAQLPSVDLEITFEFNSSEISPAALPTLALLGRALSDPRLADANFLIGGHTDSKGRADYNRHLSQLRADAVRAFLISSYGIAPKRLVAKGFGESRLKNPANPQGEENRRVQVVNTSKLAAR